jgi:hypothetical protein
MSKSKVLTALAEMINKGESKIKNSKGLIDYIDKATQEEQLPATNKLKSL